MGRSLKEKKGLKILNVKRLFVLNIRHFEAEKRSDSAASEKYKKVKKWQKVKMC
jgi:hypothetical protein